MHKIITPALIVIGAAIIAGCSGAAGTSKPVEPEPVEEGPPSLQGVWTATVRCRIDGVVGQSTNTLTFTKSRWILQRICEGPDSLLYSYMDSGEWSIEGTTVTRTRFRSSGTTSAVKEIVWSEDENQFTSHPFHWRESDRPDARRSYTRSNVVLPSLVGGVWEAVWFNAVDRFQFFADGSFTYLQQGYGDQDRTQLEWRIAASGKWEIDEEENFIHVTDVVARYLYSVTDPIVTSAPMNGTLVFASISDIEGKEELIFYFTWSLVNAEGREFWTYLDEVAGFESWSVFVREDVAP